MGHRVRLNSKRIPCGRPLFGLSRYSVCWAYLCGIHSERYGSKLNLKRGRAATGLFIQVYVVRKFAL